MPRPRKFIKGAAFQTISGLAFWLESGRWVYWGPNPKHPAVLMNMSLRVLMNTVAHRFIFRAIKNPAWIEKQKQAATVPF